MTTKKITEFKLYPTVEQSAKIDLWLAQLKWVWNSGLSLLEESQQREWRVKQEWKEPSPETWQWRKSCKIGDVIFENPNGEDGKPVFGLCCPYYPDRCDRRKHQEVEAPYKAVKNCHFIANMRCPDFLHLIDISSRRSVVDSLIDSWSQYRKGKKGRPRYKGKADRLESFSNANGRIYVGIVNTGDRDNAYIDYPKLGQIKCKGLFRRYAGNHTIVRIVKRADGYYVQFTSDVDEKPVKHAKKGQVGLDFGVIAPIADSDGRLHKSKRYAKLQAKKLAKLQRSICRSVDGSSRLKVKRKKLAKIHLKIARQRDRFIHKLTSKYVSEYQQIAIEDTKVRNMVRAPNPKQGENGGYLPNGSAAKAGLNKSLHDVAIGKMKTMLETKSKASQREFVKVPAPHTSQGCAECGYYSKKFRPNQATFECLNCGNSDNADNNASKVIRNIAFTGLVLKPYSASSEEVKDVDRASHGKKRQPSKTRKSKKGSAGETSAAINRESGDVRGISDTFKSLPDVDLRPKSSASIRADSIAQSQQDFELWQDLKPDNTQASKNRSRKRSAQCDPDTASQLGFWDLTVAIADELAS